ncbi:hypothetical protein EMCG_01611 [[Emmonsia] crescens]|uniref:Protein kinase domain-containing protein n=1 Tax=[Emmonsia] crescens TaxID=73230 RepID=A0A0G2I168_9EURO|nr:hypothetical protein EMCG_01611 [Emmonsia crescens UAMH 3008]
MSVFNTQHDLTLTTFKTPQDLYIFELKMASYTAEIEDLRCRLQEQKKRADEEKKRADEEKERADEEARGRKREKERADRLAAEQAPTPLLTYLQLVKEKLISSLSVEPDPTKSSSGLVTTVNGKYYPPKLCHWADFANLHESRFSQLAEAFSDNALFPSRTNVQGVEQDLSPTTRKDELDLRPFIRTAIEKPAQRLVQAYLRQTKDSQTKDSETVDFRFQSNAYSLFDKDNPTPTNANVATAQAEAPPSKKQSPERFKEVPDRWGIRKLLNGEEVTTLVGEYKAAHKLPSGSFKDVFQAAGESLFLDTLRRLSSPTVDEAKEQSTVVKVLCQIFDYMIKAGLQYGYLTSGHELVFLMVKEGDVQTLYYHFTAVTYRANSSPSNSPRAIDVCYGPVSQLTTFVLLSLESAKRSPQWIESAKSRLWQWPLFPSTLNLADRPRLESLYKDYSSSSSGDERPKDEDGSYRSSRQPRKRQLTEDTKMTTRRSSRTQHQRQHQSQHQSQRPTLPYCTQACLLGLSQGHPLDESCPNFSSHQQGGASHNHLISKEELCSLVNDQLARNLDENCQCLDTWGMFGAVGVLFKITLTDYGYTFVAKGVQAVDERSLLHEAKVYAHLLELQGVIVPVHLGNIKLVQTYPLVSLATVTSMMLMSWAGNNLHSKDYGPDVDIDIEAQKQQSIVELNAAGLVHDDLRQSNMVWNQERQRVMVIDFDQSKIQLPQRKRPGDGGPSSVLGVKRARVDKENLNTAYDLY